MPILHLLEFAFEKQLSIKLFLKIGFFKNIHLVQTIFHLKFYYYSIFL
jgi:hypothetical protein